MPSNISESNKVPKVTVVSITYNQADFVADALEGFVSQKTDFDFEVLVADDCSTDATPAIISDYAARYPDIIKPILRNKNLGSVPNLLSVLREARGEYIAICEGDDFWTDTDKLQKQVTFLDEHPDSGGCFHRVRVIYTDEDQPEYIFPEVEDAAWYTTEELLRTNYIPTNSVMYRRRDYDHMPTDIMPYDWYLHLFHAQFGPLSFIDEVMSVYRKHKGGLWWNYDKDRDEIWKKYGIAYLKMLEAVKTLFASDPTKLAIMNEAVRMTIDTLLAVDKRHGTNLIPVVMKTFPEQFIAYAMVQQSKLETEMGETRKLTKELLAVGDERNLLMAQLAAEQDGAATMQEELVAIKGSRMWRMHKKAEHMRKKIVPGKQ